MKIKYFFWYLLLIILFFISCKKETKVFPDLTKDEINGSRLWERITKEDNYKKYPLWPGHEGMQPGEVPHGSYHKVYVNSKLINALPISDRITPSGLRSSRLEYQLNLAIRVSSQRDWARSYGSGFRKKAAIGSAFFSISGSELSMR